MKDIPETEEDDPLPFVGRFSLQDDPSFVAKDILKTLGIDPSHYTATSPFREWLEKAEAKGLYISRSSLIHSRMKLDSDELQGFALADPYAPFVFVNSDDWDAPQLFTLVHEIAHIWIAESGISNEIELVNEARDKLHPVELFCNKVAAIALMPEGIIRSLNADTFSSSENVLKAAKGLGVSSFTFLVRAFQLELISTHRYRALKKDADNAFKSFLEREAVNAAKLKEKKGGPNYFLMLTNKNGQHFTRVVMDAFKGGFIQPSEASLRLNTQVNNSKTRIVCLQMSTPIQRYCLDANVLIQGWQKYYSPKLCASYWDVLNDLGKNNGYDQRRKDHGKHNKNKDPECLRTSGSEVY